MEAFSLSDVPAFAWSIIDTRRYEIAFILSAILFEIIVRSKAVTRLATKSYALDLFYAAFYRLGVFAVLLDLPLRAFLYDQLTVPVVESAPIWLKIAMYLLCLEVANYWIHRVSHASSFLWAFHQVHHSQEHLTIMSTYRNHPVDVFLRNNVGPVFFMFIFGIPPAIWLPVALLWDVNLNLSHLEVDWTYGPLKWVLVSPVYHSIHHSVESRHQGTNFAQTLSFLDRVFGTDDQTPRRPASVGLEGWTVRESFFAQVWAPIRGLVRHYRGLPEDDLAPLTLDPVDAAESSQAGPAESA